MRSVEPLRLEIESVQKRDIKSRGFSRVETIHALCDVLCAELTKVQAFLSAPAEAATDA